MRVRQRVARVHLQQLILVYKHCHYSRLFLFELVQLKHKATLVFNTAKNVLVIERYLLKFLIMFLAE